MAADRKLNRTGPMGRIAAAGLSLAVLASGCGDAGVALTTRGAEPIEPAGTVGTVAPPAVAAPPATTTSTSTTTTAAARLGIDPDLAYPTIDPAIGIEPFVPQSMAGIRLEPIPGTVALTFDDGPDPEYTPMILDILAEHGAVATFFVLGWKVDAHPEIARRIVAEGHSLQNHAYRHHNLTNRSDAAVAGLINDTAEAIFEASGTTSTCLRPPQGISNNRLVQTAADNGHAVLLWDSRGNSLDYSLGTTSGVLARAAAWEAGDVTLMHDTWGFLYRTALPQILEDLADRGIGTSLLCVPRNPLPVPEVQ